MAKSYKYFKNPFNTSNRSGQNLRYTHSGGNIYRYSMYMQSKDRSWISRNTVSNHEDDFEPIEEDIRD